MLLGELFTLNGLVTPDDIEAALEEQRQQGGLLGDILVAAGKISREAVEQVVGAIPAPPSSLEDTGLGLPDLLNLLAKVLHSGSTNTAAKAAEAMRLPTRLLQQLVDEAKAASSSNSSPAPPSRRRPASRSPPPGGTGRSRPSSRTPTWAPPRCRSRTTSRASSAKPSATSGCPRRPWPGRWPAS